MIKNRRVQQVSWALFDFANSAFPTVITTFVFAAYFTKSMAENEAQGTALWGYATAAAALMIALCAPVFGAIADHSGRKKVWLFIFSAICMAASVGLWGALPGQSFIFETLVLVALATFGFEMAIVFYNAMLGQVATPGREGRLSGYAWGLGYVGGLLGLVVLLKLFVQAEVPFLGLEKDSSEHIRISGPFVALWYGLFALPLFFFVPTEKVGLPLSKAVSKGLGTLKETLTKWREQKDVFKYLLTRMIYTDGINTLFAFGGIYAAGTFKMSFEELIIFGLGMNITAAIGAALFGWLDDKAGPKKVIVLSLMAMTGLGLACVLVNDKTVFTALALGLGLFMGPVQAASRTYMLHAAPKGLENEMFGLYALSGKATAFLGPLMVALMSDFFASQRAGMGVVVVFLVIGLAMMWRLPDIRSRQS